MFQTERRVIVITGPIASGRSAGARELAREFERTHVRVAVIDLDTFLEEGVAVVIAEGSFSIRRASGCVR